MTEMNTMTPTLGKRIGAILLALMLCLNLVPTAAWADEISDGEAPVELVYEEPAADADFGGEDNAAAYDAFDVDAPADPVDEPAAISEENDGENTAADDRADETDADELRAAEGAAGEEIVDTGAAEVEEATDPAAAIKEDADTDGQIEKTEETEEIEESEETDETEETEEIEEVGLPDVDYIFPAETVKLTDILSALGITLSQNNYNVSVDSAAIELSGNKVNKKKLASFTLTARESFDLATLTLTSTNGKDSHSITLAYAAPDPEEPEQEELTEYLPEDALWANDALYLTGKLPGNAVVEATPVTVTIEGQEVLAAYDIKIYTNANQQRKGKTWQPAGDKVQVHFFDDAFGDRALSVYHMADTDAAPELVADVTALNGEVTFDAASFSVYAVTTVLEKTIAASDGNTYKISVTFDAAAQIPEGAVLDVAEILPEDGVYDEYLARTMDALALDGVAYARLFDISIVDAEDTAVHYQPQAAVDVKIELLDAAEDSDSFHVVHFGATAESLSASTDGNTVSFSTDGFSAYAVVKGPSEVPIGWTKITTLDQLAALGSQGLYIGHTGGYYLTDEIEAVNNTTTKGIKKTKPAKSFPADAAVLYYFESAGEDGKYKLYCVKDEAKNYVQQSADSLIFAGAEDATVFVVTRINNSGTFRISSKDGKSWWNMKGSANGTVFSLYSNGNDSNNNLYFWHYEQTSSDPYGLDGKSYGLMSWNDAVTGRAMMARTAESDENALEALPLTVMTKKNNNANKLFIANDTDITFWTFEWTRREDLYQLKANTDSGTRFLKMTKDGLTLVTDKNEATDFQVVPGSGTHAGDICLKADNVTLTFMGSVEAGFKVKGTAGSEWLKLLDESSLTSDYLMTYSASKVSVSDSNVTNGSRIIVYTRTWNDTTKKYEFYAIDHDGSLVPCFESGDSIQWVAGRFNTLLWNLVEYYWEGTNDPNYFYELYNQYSEKYIAPQVTGGQILSDDTIGINLIGRRNGAYYSTILAWDEDNYAYAGLKVEDGKKVVSCPIGEADDFYFAIMEEQQIDDTLTTVPTIDHQQYGISVKVIDFPNRDYMNSFMGGKATDKGLSVAKTTPGLVSTRLGEDGYPTLTKNNNASLGNYFAGAQEVNHLFIESTYYSSGYYEFDSTQNFAHLITAEEAAALGDPTLANTFRVYKELGTMDVQSKPSLKHGQFMPFNDLEAGVFASVNPKNLFSATLASLPNTDPRKNEQMYLVQNPNYQFGVEIEASFTQTRSGLDAWGHDIIYEFTGDDDFWLYVDGELVLDLGGTHAAAPGSVNYSTGEVTYNDENGNLIYTTLKDVFYNNYLGRDHTEDEAQAYVDGIFEPNENGQYVFKDYTTHTMRIFFMERGAGASNLHMRFNLASVKPGTVELSKELSGVDSTESILAEFPFQVYYKLPVEVAEGEEAPQPEPMLLTQGDKEVRVYYKDTINPVTYRDSITIDGVTYNSVFMVKAGETIEIDLPEAAAEYRIVECGVNTEIFDKVTVNDKVIQGKAPGKESTVEDGAADSSNYLDFGIDWALTNDRARVAYVNNVNPKALRTLTITKKLYKENGTDELNYDNDDTTFSFRLYFATEYDKDLDAANMYTYHVLDPDGYYCSWNAAMQKFTATEYKADDYDDLSDAVKASLCFTTSMNGSISKIAAGYAVVVRDLLAGTRFKVVERPTDIPDGYSFQKYIYNREEYHPSTVHDDAYALAGVTETLTADATVEVCNLRGWGLRVNKLWSDADYMSQRDATYFAIFAQGDDGTLNLVDGSVRQLPYNAAGQTLYWYYLKLPVDNVPFEKYLIREVTVTDPEFDTDGVVTGYRAVDPIAQEKTVELHGKQKGESESARFTYTVLYEQGTVDEDSHVRVDTVTNNRPGIVLRKQDFSGHALPGAVFELKDEAGDIIGTFTSDDAGQITVAFLRDDVDYTLKEISTPQGYYGLPADVTIRLSNGVVTVDGIEADYYALEQGEGKTPTLTVKNRPMTFQAIKVDGDTKAPLQNVSFALHHKVTVDGVSDYEVNPMPGYNKLTTGKDGVIPQLNSTLPAGEYQLRELRAASKYQKLSAHIHLTISRKGEITLGQHSLGVELKEELLPDGTIAYTLIVPNYLQLPAPTNYSGAENIGGFMIMLLAGAVVLAPAPWKRRKRGDADES